MANEGKIRCKRNSRNKVRLDTEGSDESDEDYNVSEDEEVHGIEDEYCSSLAEDESDESLAEFDEEEEDDEEEWLEEKVKTAVRSSRQTGFQRRKKNGTVKTRKKILSDSEEEEDYEDNSNVNAKQRKRNDISYKERNDDVFESLFRHGMVGFRNKALRSTRAKVQKESLDQKPRKKTKVSYREEKEDGEDDDSGDDDDVEFTPDEAIDLDEEEEELPVAKKTKVSYREDKEDDDYDDSGDDDDVEFTLDEVAIDLDDEEESPVPRNRVSRFKKQDTKIAGKRKRRNPKVSKRAKRKKNVTEKKSRKKNRSESSDIDMEFEVDRTFHGSKKPSQQSRGRSRKQRINSDSDFVCSGASDFEFTISEEEREQVREASAFCKRSSRASSSLKMAETEKLLPVQRKRLVRKGKEKVSDLKIEVGKEVCGICLSEEGKRRVRGVLNCCSHYFCFGCIFEWSKVETRCPLCKQRFKTITKTTLADGVPDSKDPVIAVQERDQVYQPSEEEVRGYLDPYESVLCTECMHGGDDAHMLLCDLCDSPAHTYCVGLGNEVPDGNWYCEGCRPTVLASANTPTSQIPNTEQNTTTNNLSDSSSPPPALVRETFDLNEEYVPETPLTPMTGSHSPVEISQAAVPASTLFARRRVHQRVHQFRNRSVWPDVGIGSGTTLFGTQIGQNITRSPSQHFLPTRTTRQEGFYQGRVQNYGIPQIYNTEIFYQGLSNLRGQALRDQGSTSMDQFFGGVPSNGEYSRSNQQLPPCSSRSNNGVGNNMLSYQFREAAVPSRTLQGSHNPPF